MADERLTPYLIVIMHDRVARIELRKDTKFIDLDPELYEAYHAALKANDLMMMGAFLEDLDKKYKDILYLMNT